jgi:uncharacterized membrane protein
LSWVHFTSRGDACIAPANPFGKIRLLFDSIGCKMMEIKSQINSEELMENQPMDVTSDDKLWVLLAYILSPLIPIVIMLMEDKKNRPFIRAHNAQALVLGVIEVILYSVFSWFFGIGACLGVLLWFAMIYWGIQGYQGKYVNIPVVTDFVKNQGWA